MSLFRNTIYDDGDVSFAPVFRFIDAFDNFQRAASSSDVAETAGASKDLNNNNNNNNKATPRSLLRSVASFNPKFDVVETKEAYELHGDIPGAERDNVSIEFTEPQTIVIHGRVERSYSSAPDGQDGSQQASKGGESHKVTVADEEEEKARESGAVAKADAAGDVAVKKTLSSGTRFWVQERSVGEFSRTFTFPVRVDESNVKATFNNGVLKVTVPKQEKPVSRRIDIS